MQKLSSCPARPHYSGEKHYLGLGELDLEGRISWELITSAEFPFKNIHLKMSAVRSSVGSGFDVSNDETDSKTTGFC